MLYGIIMKKMGKVAALGFMIALIGIPAACGPKNAKQEPAGTVNVPASESAAPGLKRIKAISAMEEGETVVVSITGTTRLTYTSVKQPLPMGLVLYFPETGLDADQTDITVGGDLVESIKAAELIENGPTKIVIGLKKDVPYRMSQEDDGAVLKVTFSQSSAETSEVEASGGDVAIEEQTISEAPSITPEGSSADPEQITQAEPSLTASDTGSDATRLSGISIKAETDFLEIHIQADGRVKKYNHFTLTEPARIVFDLYGIRSTEPKKTVAINSRWAKNVRYLAYPDHVRVVIDTEKSYLSGYTADSAADGIHVKFGSAPSSAEATEPMTIGVAETAAVEVAPAEVAVAEVAVAEVEQIPAEDTASSETSETVEIESAPAMKRSVADEAIQAESGGGSAAWVKSIEFFSEANGESTLVIETTRPVKHVLNKKNDRQLELDLYNTRISSNRQRPLITTRFESALDRILPVHNASLGRNSRVIIELRENVPYTEKEEDARLQIRFAASSVSPRPLEEAGLPDWQTVLEKSNVEAAGEPVALEPIVAEVTGTEMPEESGESSVAPTSELEPLGEIALGEDVGVEAENEFVDLYSLKKKTYTGEKIALDFYQTDIKNVLRILRDVSGKNFAIDKDVKGAVTLSLVKPVPWDQVLDLILKMNGLGYIDEGDIIRIATVKTVQDEEKRRQETLSAKQSIKDKEIMLEELETEYISVSYSGAENLLSHVNAVVTPRGKTSVDARTNQIIITDVPSVIEKAKQIVKRLDKVTPQVVIEARIVEVSDSFSKAIGSEWGASGGPVERHELGGAYDWDVAMNHPTNYIERAGFNFGRILGTPFSLNARLIAMESQNEGKIISSPRILTLDNKKASIKQGIEWPYLGVDSNGLATTQFKDIDLLLEVTPQVTPDNRINLKVNITKNDIDQITSGGVPALATNTATTELLVNDGDTIVIGGILKTNENRVEERMPWLNKIPVLGWLFKATTQTSDRRELLMFMTPRIVQLEQR